MLSSMLRRMLKLYQSLGLTSYLFIYSMLFLFVIYKIKDNISVSSSMHVKREVYQYQLTEALTSLSPDH